MVQQIRQATWIALVGFDLLGENHSQKTSFLRRNSPPQRFANSRQAPHDKCSRRRHWGNKFYLHSVRIFRRCPARHPDWNFLRDDIPEMKTP